MRKSKHQTLLAFKQANVYATAFLSFKDKYSPEQSVLKHPQNIFFPKNEMIKGRKHVKLSQCLTN
jgi:hypothetical protein